MSQVRTEFETAIETARHALTQFSAEPMVASKRGGPRLSPWWRVWPARLATDPQGYARPKAASPVYASLVPAYEPCSTPNRKHAAPLSFGTCNPPAQTSGFATVGTPDANTQPAKSVGSLKLKAIGEVPINTGNGNQSDLEIDVSYTDVRQAPRPPTTTPPACAPR